MNMERTDAALKQLLLGGLFVALPLLTYPLAIFPREIFEDVLTRRFDVVVPWGMIGAVLGLFLVAIKLLINREGAVLSVPRGWFLVLCFFGLAASVSLAGARQRGLSVNATANIFASLALALAAMCWEQRAGLRSLATCCVVAGGMAAGFALMQWGFRDFKTDVNISAMLGNPNLLASYLIFCVPLVVCWVMNARDAHSSGGAATPAKIIGGVLVLFGILVALRNTHARAAWGALGVTAAIAAAGGLAMRNPRRARLVASGLVLAVGLVAAVARPYLARVFAEDVRVEIWRGTWSLIQQHPVTGAGAGTFFAEYPPHRTAAYFEKPKAALLTDHAHNEWLETWAELGALGLIALLVVWFYAAHQWWHRRTEMRAENWAFALAAMALMAHGTFEVSLRHPPSQFLVWLALGLSLSGLPLPTWDWRPPRIVRLCAGGALLLVCAGAGYFFVGKPLQSDIHWRRANMLLDKGEDGAEVELGAAVDAQPFRVEAIYRRAVLLEKQLAAAQAEQLRGKFEQLIERDLLRVKNIAPHYRGVNRKLGLLYCRRGDYSRGIAFLEAEVALNKGAPLNPAIAAEFAADHFWLGRAYFSAGRVSDAKESLRRAAQLDPNHAEAKEWLQKLGD
jgi:O-antigen ligase